MNTSQMLGLVLIIVGVIELVLLSLVGVVKRKPILLLIGIGSGVVTGIIGLLIYLGKIPLG